MAWWRDVASRVRASLAVGAGVGAAVAGLGCWAGPAAGETGPPSSTGAASCPSTGFASASPAGTPTTLTAGVGATESAPAGARFPIRLAVTVSDAESAPVPGALVTFAAPNRGPSGFFTVRSDGANLITSRAPSAGTSGSQPPRPRVTHPHRVQVRTNACGVALAPAFTANHRAGGYVVVASVEGVKAAFALVNEAR
jgi:hypothetical protein